MAVLRLDLVEDEALYVPGEATAFACDLGESGSWYEVGITVAWYAHLVDGREPCLVIGERAEAIGISDGCTWTYGLERSWGELTHEEVDPATVPADLARRITVRARPGGATHRVPPKPAR